MKLAFIGAGYVGLVTAAVFAKLGNESWVVDTDEKKIKKLSRRKIPFYEPGLSELVKESVSRQTLYFTSSYKEAIFNSEMIFICVGTPSRRRRIDLSSIYSATRSVAENLENPVIVVIKSTVPPGINPKIEKWMKRFTRVNFDIAAVPEFLREGRALEDSLHPYRVVIGAEKKSVARKLLILHRKISGKRLVCSSTSAQMIKYASNAFLPTKISFANSIAILCDKYGANIDDVVKGMGMDKRIGSDFLGAGLGYGGSCFPKDVAALISLAEASGYSFNILKAVEKTNKKQLDYFLEKVIRLCQGTVKGKTLVILGLSFKPSTSDMREAPSLYIIDGLKKLGAVIRACDPVAISEARKVINGVKFFNNVYNALRGSDALLLVTEWDEYRSLDFAKIKRLMKSPVVVDGRNIYNRKILEALGFIYAGVGK